MLSGEDVGRYWSAMLLSIAAALSAEPHFSYPKLVTANGYGVAVLNGANDGGVVLDVFSDHLYQQYSADDEPTRDLLWDTYFGLRAEGDSGWLTDSASYQTLAGTGVLEIDRSRGSLLITEYAFASMQDDSPALVHLLRVENPTGDALDAELFLLENFHVGDSTSENEAIQPEGEGLVLWGENTGLTMHFSPLVTPSRTDCSPNDPWYAVNEGWDLDECSYSAGDDRIGAFQWSLVLDAGAVEWIGVVDHFGDGEVLSGDPETLLDEEIAWWQAWHDEGEPAYGLTDEEYEVYYQALAYLKMSQVREEGDAYGQIPASLPLSAPVGEFQHIWNISWVRDGAYAIRALTAAGHYPEARAALAFQVQPGKTGDWVSYVGGMDHALSICRIYGNGDEWTDVDDDGPNIEFDNFGLYLWAFGAYVRATNDVSFAEEHEEALLDKTADVLVVLVDPSTGLITADSSIWERHWNGNQKQFTYTSAWAVRGLREATYLAEKLSDARSVTYSEEADALAAAIEQHLVRDDGVLVGNLEEHTASDPAMDLAAVDAFNNGALDVGGESFSASMEAWERDLGLASGPGFKRNDDGDLYDEQEWIMVDLRVAEALRRACRDDEAAEIEDWVTEQAQANHLIVPELLEPTSADYAGPAPMMGFGSGLYVLQMHTRETDYCSGDTGPDDTGGDTDDPGGATHPDCGCSATALPASLALLPLLLLRRRR